jgi:hypothetical protein
MKNEKNEGMIEKMKMNREIKFVEYKQIENQLINVFINEHRFSCIFSCPNSGRSDRNKFEFFIL